MTVTIKNPFRTEWNPVRKGFLFFLEMKSNPLRRKLESAVLSCASRKSRDEPHEIDENFYTHI